MKEIIDEILLIREKIDADREELEEMLEQRRTSKLSAKVKPSKRDIQQMIKNYDDTFCQNSYFEFSGYIKEERLNKLHQTGQDKFCLSKELDYFFARTTMFGGALHDETTVGDKAFGDTLGTIDLAQDNQLILDFIEQNILPKVMSRFLILAWLDDGEHLLGTWLYDDTKETTEILAFSLESRSLKLISNSFHNFLRRGIECYKSNTVQNYFSPTKPALKIIREVDGDKVFPKGEEFFLTFTEDWPNHWQEIASDI